eukprot:gene9733-2060_t
MYHPFCLKSRDRIGIFYDQDNFNTISYYLNGNSGIFPSISLGNGDKINLIKSPKQSLESIPYRSEFEVEDILMCGDVELETLDGMIIESKVNSYRTAKQSQILKNEAPVYAALSLCSSKAKMEKMKTVPQFNDVIPAFDLSTSKYYRFSGEKIVKTNSEWSAIYSIETFKWSSQMVDLTRIEF